MALPPSVASGSSVTIYATPESGDPTQVELELVGVNTATIYATATVTVGSQMTFDIPSTTSSNDPWVFRLYVWVNLLMDAHTEQVLRGLCIRY